MRNQKGIIHLLPLLLVGILIVGVGMWWYGNKNGSPVISKASPSPTAENNSREISIVDEEWKMYKGSGLGHRSDLINFTIKYPVNWTVQEYNANGHGGRAVKFTSDLSKLENAKYELQLRINDFDFGSLCANMTCDKTQSTIKVGKNEYAGEYIKASMDGKLNYNSVEIYLGEKYKSPRIFGFYGDNADLEVIKEMLDSFEFVE